MKTVPVLIVIMILAASLLYSKGKVPTDKKEMIYQSLNMALESGNYGLRTSAIYMLGEACCTKAEITLMRILKSDEDEVSRILAALSLSKLGGEMGIFAVKQAGRFDGSKRVRRICTSLYVEHFLKETSVSG